MPSKSVAILLSFLLLILGLPSLSTKFSLINFPPVCAAVSSNCCSTIQCYRDIDGDGNAVGGAVTECATPGCPAGWIVTPKNNPVSNPDCDDNNASVGTNPGNNNTTFCPASGTQIGTTPPVINAGYGNCSWSLSGGQYTATCPYGSCSFSCGPYNQCPAAGSCPTWCGYGGGQVPNGNCGYTTCGATGSCCVPSGCPSEWSGGNYWNGCYTMYCPPASSCPPPNYPPGCLYIGCGRSLTPGCPCVPCCPGASWC